MGERLRAYVSPSHLLKAIVANCARRLYSGFHIALIDEIALRSRVSPHASQAIRLQLQANGEWIGRGRVPLLEGMHLVCNAKKILNVVSDLVSQYIRLCELTRSAKPVFNSS